MRTPCSILLLFAAGLCCPAVAVAPQAPEPRRPVACELPEPVTRDTTLVESCEYPGGIVVAGSNLTLDCGGAVIDAAGARVGITIRGRGLHDILVRNCRIQHPMSIGILVSSDLEEGAKSRLPVAERYAASPSRVSIQDASVVGAGNAGIYVDSYARDTRIQNVTVAASGGPGIYLEFSSVRTVVTDSTITGNGYGTPDKPRRGGGLREGLAIDSSSDNRISRSRFSGNAAGGVFLYKNCHEHQERKDSVPRWMPAAHNLIEANSFEEAGTGVWIASRQSRNLRSWNCGDPAYAPGFYRDYAPDTTVSGNSFSGGRIGTRIEDDGAVVSGNVMSGVGACVIAGTSKRSEVLGLPVTGTVIRDNSCSGSTSDSFLFLFGSTPRACDGNTVEGKLASCNP